MFLVVELWGLIVKELNNQEILAQAALFLSLFFDSHDTMNVLRSLDHSSAGPKGKRNY